MNNHVLISVIVAVLVSGTLLHLSDSKEEEVDDQRNPSHPQSESNITLRDLLEQQQREVLEIRERRDSQ